MDTGRGGREAILWTDAHLLQKCPGQSNKDYPSIASINTKVKDWEVGLGPSGWSLRKMESVCEDPDSWEGHQNNIIIMCGKGNMPWHACADQRA